MKNIIFIYVGLLIASTNLSSSECTKFDNVDLNEGDVISAEMLNDIFNRLDGITAGITSSELDGVWECKSYNKGVGTENGYEADSTGVGSSMSQDVSFTLQSDGSFLVTYPNNLGQNSMASSANTCKAKLVDGGYLAMTDANTGNCYNSSLAAVRKIGKQCFVWEVTNSFPLASVTQCSKKSTPPVAPSDLKGSISSGIISLNWTAGDNTETAYDVQRKNSSDGSFASIGTPTAESYEDSTIAKGNSYWYRVFATNANGTSVGSNVIQISYLNTPPSMNLSSTISVNEGVTEVVNVGATDADGDSLTYTLGSQDPSNDATNFSISTAGVISFNSAPDWENPSDYNTDNIYTINVSVSDGTETVIQDISIVVQNIDD
tara:strand:+ start:441 stop:1568 length:1128 start_codon:yes stop_codon:yes gene_type:complete